MMEVKGRGGGGGEQAVLGLPSELGIAILRFMCPPDLASFSLVCRAAKALAEENSLWRDLCARSFPQWAAEWRHITRHKPMEDWKKVMQRGHNAERNWRTGRAFSSPTACVTQPSTGPIDGESATATAHQQASHLALSDGNLFLVTGRLDSDCNVVYMYETTTHANELRFVRSFVHEAAHADQEMEGINFMHAYDGCDQLVSCDSSVHAWRPSNGARIFRYDPPNASQLLLCCHFWHGRPNIVACGSNDQSISLFDLDKTEADRSDEESPAALIRKLSGHEDVVYCLEIYDNLLVSGSGRREGHIHLTDIETSSLLWWAQPGYRHKQNRTIFHDPNTILSSGQSEFARMWDVRAGKQVARLHHGDWYHIDALRSSADRHLIATGSGTSVRLWDDRKLERIEAQAVMDIPDEDEEWLDATEKEKQGNIPGMIGSLKEHECVIDDLVFNSRLMITGSADELRVWDFSAANERGC